MKKLLIIILILLMIGGLMFMSNKIFGIGEDKCLKEIYSKGEINKAFINGRLFTITITNSSQASVDVSDKLPSFVNTPDEIYVLSVKHKRSIETAWDSGLSSGSWISFNSDSLTVHNALDQSTYKILILLTNSNTIKND